MCTHLEFSVLLAVTASLCGVYRRQNTHAKYTKIVGDFHEPPETRKNSLASPKLFWFVCSRKFGTFLFATALLFIYNLAVGCFFFVSCLKINHVKYVCLTKNNRDPRPKGTTAQLALNVFFPVGPRTETISNITSKRTLGIHTEFNR